MPNIAVLEKTVELMKDGKEVALVTVISASGSTPRGAGTKMLISEDGSLYGTIGGGSLEGRVIDISKEALKKGESLRLNLSLDKEDLKMECGGAVQVFIDVHKTRPKLLIAGGGHVSLAIYKIASILDFHIAIFEDREELLTKERFPLATELILGDIKENLGKYPIDENTHIVIVTRGHEYDEESLESVIESSAKYIGVMGSKRKVETMMKNLQGKGLTDDLLSKVYTPIGLNLGGETPEEVAMSILSEILLVKNDGSPRHMKKK